MTMALFLQSLAFNLLTNAIPLGFAVYLGIKLGLRNNDKDNPQT